MKNLMKIGFLAAAVSLASCSATDDIADNEKQEISPRQGEEVQQVCNINGWTNADHEHNALIVNTMRRESFRLTLVGICDPDWAMHRIAMSNKSGRDCITRGDRIITDANTNRGAFCTVTKIHKWLPLDEEQTQGSDEGKINRIVSDSL